MFPVPITNHQIFQLQKKKDRRKRYEHNRNVFNYLSDERKREIEHKQKMSKMFPAYTPSWKPLIDPKILKPDTPIKKQGIFRRIISYIKSKLSWRK